MVLPMKRIFVPELTKAPVMFHGFIENENHMTLV